MAEVKDLEVNVSVNSDGFKAFQADSEKSLESFNNSTLDVTSTFNNLNKELELFGKNIQKINSDSTFAQSIQQSTDQAKNSIKDLANESKNTKSAFDVVFGGFIDGIKEWIKNITEADTLGGKLFITFSGFVGIVRILRSLAGALKLIGTTVVNPKESFNKLKNVITSIRDRIKSLVPRLKSVLEVIKNLGSRLLNLFKIIGKSRAFGLFLNVIRAVGTFLGGALVLKIGLVVAALGGIYLGVRAVIDHWDELKLAAQITWEENIVPLIESAAENIAYAIGLIGDAVLFIWDNFKAGAEIAWNFVTEKATAGVEWIGQQYERLTSWLGEQWEAIKETAANAWEAIKTDYSDEIVDVTWEEMETMGLTDMVEANEVSNDEWLGGINKVMYSINKVGRNNSQEIGE